MTIPRQKPLHIGDLVDFRSSFFASISEKIRPGIILEIEKKEVENSEYINNQVSCLVLWANGRTTNEFYSILEHYDDIPRDSRV